MARNMKVEPFETFGRFVPSRLGLEPSLKQTAERKPEGLVQLCMHYAIAEKEDIFSCVLMIKKEPLMPRLGTAL